MLLRVYFVSFFLYPAASGAAYMSAYSMWLFFFLQYLISEHRFLIQVRWSMFILCVILQQAFAKFILDQLETCLQMENLSERNPVKDKFPVSNLFVYFSVQVDEKLEQKTGLRRNTLLNSYWMWKSE